MNLKLIAVLGKLSEWKLGLGLVAQLGSFSFWFALGLARILVSPITEAHETVQKLLSNCPKTI